MRNWQLLQSGQKSWDSFKMYTQLTRAIREFFWSKNFTEFDSPILNTSFPQEPNIYLTPVTWQQQQKLFYLEPSPESSAKKLLSAGIGNCFTLAKCVRDLEDLGPTHNLEFSLLEFYQVNANYRDLAKLVLEMFTYLETKLNVSGLPLSPWKETTVRDLFQQHGNLNLDNLLTTKAMISACQNLGYNMEGVTTWEPGFNQIWANLIEPALPQTPTLVFDYPIQISTLCKPCPDPRYGQRFELYIAGMEFGNCYTELQNQQLQAKNFQETLNEKQNLGKPIHPIDTDFLKSLDNLPPCSGIALGLERLAMFFSKTQDIANVVYFPTKELI